MTPEGGGFFAAQDADSGGHEGTFYVWNPESVREAVGAGRRAARVRAVRRDAGRQLRRRRDGPLGASGRRRISPRSSAKARRGVARDPPRARGPTMYAARARRVPPGTDDKLLTDWTALAISAFALGARRLARAALRAGGARGRRPDPAALPAGRAAPSPRARGQRRRSRLLGRLRVLRRGAPRPLRGDVRPARLPAGRRPPGRARPPLRRSARRLRALLRRARRIDPEAARAVRRRDAVGQFRRGVEPAPPRRVHGRRAPIAARRGDLRGLLGLPAPRAPRAAPDALRARFRDVGASRDRARPESPAAPDFEGLRDAVFDDADLNRVVAHADAAESLADLCPLVAGRGAAGDGRAPVRERMFAAISPAVSPSRRPAALAAALGRSCLTRPAVPHRRRRTAAAGTAPRPGSRRHSGRAYAVLFAAGSSSLWRTSRPRRRDLQRAPRSAAHPRATARRAGRRFSRERA